MKGRMLENGCSVTLMTKSISSMLNDDSGDQNVMDYYERCCIYGGCTRHTVKDDFYELLFFEL
jgi:hypothetical protein